MTVTTETWSQLGGRPWCSAGPSAARIGSRTASSRSGLRSAAIHGDRSQAQRERALAAFQAGRLDVLVATDVAARGIHVDAVPLVVHYDPPADSTDYVHRSGRTGRAGADGLVVSLIGHEHVRDTKLTQRKLGLPDVITAPDIAGLFQVDGSRPPRSSRPVAESSHVATAPTKRGRVHSHESPRPPRRGPRRQEQRASRPKRRTHR